MFPVPFFFPDETLVGCRLFALGLRGDHIVLRARLVNNGIRVVSFWGLHQSCELTARSSRPAVFTVPAPRYIMTAILAPRGGRGVAAAICARRKFAARG